MNLKKFTYKCPICCKEGDIFWDLEASKFELLDENNKMDITCNKCFHRNKKVKAKGPCLVVECKRKKCYEAVLSLRFSNKTWDEWWKDLELFNKFYRNQ